MLISSSVFFLANNSPVRLKNIYKSTIKDGMQV